MIGYSALEVFTKAQRDLLMRATALVAMMPDRLAGDYVRCHEVARAVKMELELQRVGWLDVSLEVVDGRYHVFEHSWIVVRSTIGMGAILDPYSIGRLPMVQLVHPLGAHVSLYREGEPRTDVRDAAVESLRAAANETRSGSMTDIERLAAFSRLLHGNIVFCKACLKSHIVEPGETECAPGAWIDDVSRQKGEDDHD